jgi:DNA-binding LytR/AlgR family response regulator
MQERKVYHKHRFAIHIGDKIKSLETDEIAYFMADGNVVYLCSFQSDRFTINYTLEDILEKLDPEKFFRLNRTFIVHIGSIKEIRKFFNGRLKIILQPSPDPEEEVFVSRNRVSEFLKWLGE